MPIARATGSLRLPLSGAAHLRRSERDANRASDGVPAPPALD